jgi:hypothetical protein
MYKGIRDLFIERERMFFSTLTFPVLAYGIGFAAIETHSPKFRRTERTISLRLTLKHNPVPGAASAFNFNHA